MSVRRAAIDIGSGSSKLQIADIIPETGALLAILHASERPCAFGIDWKTSSDGCISTEIMEKGLGILKEYIQISTDLGVTSIHAIATEVFRNCSNGSAYIQLVEQLGITVRVVTQDLEAELGFCSVVSAHGGKEEEAVVWDSGGASFQITSRDPTSRDLRVYKGALGTSVALATLVQEVRGKKMSKDLSGINPVNFEESEMLVHCLMQKLHPAPEWLFGRPSVLAATGANAMFKVCCDVLSISNTDMQVKVGKFTLDDAEKALAICMDKTDEELVIYQAFSNAEGPFAIIPKLALLIAVMRITRVDSVTTVDVIGSCAAVLAGK